MTHQIDTTSKAPGLWARLRDWLATYEAALGHDSRDYVFDSLKNLRHDVARLSARIDNLEGRK